MQWLPSVLAASCAVRVAVLPCASLAVIACCPTCVGAAPDFLNPLLHLFDTRLSLWCVHLAGAPDPVPQGQPQPPPVGWLFRSLQLHSCTVVWWRSLCTQHQGFTVASPTGQSCKSTCFSAGLDTHMHGKPQLQHRQRFCSSRVAPARLPLARPCAQPAADCGCLFCWQS